VLSVGVSTLCSKFVTIMLMLDGKKYHYYARKALSLCAIILKSFFETILFVVLKGAMSYSNPLSLWLGCHETSFLVVIGSRRRITFQYLSVV